MSKIRILPENLSNRIAAGEVVERPASVVKELVENALDAGSSRIAIEIENGGRSLIRVSDNGCGMNKDDALLSLERYATSKIYKNDDLFSIKSLGFRGEALPSIASVSKFSLVTRDKASDAGAEILIHGGKIKKVSQIGAPTGSMVTVKQLFFNVPARRKFLKSVNTEFGHIADIISSIGLGRPDVKFLLNHNGRLVKGRPVATDPFDRVVDVLGSGLKRGLHRIKFDDDNISVAGWISSPGVDRTTSRGIYVYVNGRFVRDRIISHALFEGYEQRLMKGRFPVAVLFIDLPFDSVDVNVHPAKQEVRFAQQNMVHYAVKQAVKRGLEIAERAGWSAGPLSVQDRLSVSEPASRYSGFPTPFSDPTSDFRPPTSGLRPLTSDLRPLISDFRPPTADRRPLTSDLRSPTSGIRPLASDLRPPASEQAQIWDKKGVGDLRVIGQFHDTYILCESDKELLIIDQHAAHERIVYEHLKNRSMAGKTESQRLLVPETVDLGYKEAGILEKLIPDLKETGLEIEPFGSDTFVVKSVPAVLAGREIRPLVIEITEKIAETGFGPGIEKAIDKCLILMACHGAIRANHPLSDKEMKGLLDQLDKCKNSSHCPHGRPTWIRWSKGEIEKLFGRVV
ncbi:MAG: DNA mismatch repair protein MutL [Desulfobacteraceae bacterium Eth-SRB1]|nr:MAG: DNA mismatch repair protein MutL [Desulfobacteraceae bacterium Eth-SRB1]